MRTATFLILIILLSSCCKEDQIAPAMQKIYSNNAKDKNDGALVLAQCGSPRADRAVGRLIQLMYDENTGVQSAAAYALRRIDTPEAREALERATAARGKR